MKCFKCDGEYQLRKDHYVFEDPFVGPISVAGKPFYKCDGCNEILLTDEIIDAIEDEREKKRTESLKEYPISDFISISESWKILGLTRQAFHKNQKIKRGFIYKVKIGSYTLYLKRSIDLYIKTGDGRFPLWIGTMKSTPTYKETIVPLPIERVYYSRPIITVLNKPRFKNKTINNEEAPYVNEARY
jgi:hypothetical protein